MLTAAAPTNHAAHNPTHAPGQDITAGIIFGEFWLYNSTTALWKKLDILNGNP